MEKLVSFFSAFSFRLEACFEQICLMLQLLCQIVNYLHRLLFLLRNISFHTVCQCDAAIGIYKLLCHYFGVEASCHHCRTAALGCLGMLPVTSTVPFSCAVLSFAVNFTVAASFAPSMSVPIPASTFSACQINKIYFPSPFTSAA